MIIIAEIGWNHMGDMELAKEMIDSAVESGADICKFQTWSEKKLGKGSWDNDDRREIYKKAELTKEKHYILKDYCKNKKTKFLSSVFDDDGINIMHEINPELVKIASQEVANLDLIKKCLAKFNKVILSTGASKWNEVLKLKSLNNSDKFIIMHCVSSYPCNPVNVNMPKLQKLKEHFKHVGYSGHFAGIDDALMALSQGAEVIEKHFTTNKDLPGRDNKFALSPNELKRLCDFRDNLLKMQQDKGLDFQKCEEDVVLNYRGRWTSNER